MMADRDPLLSLEPASPAYADDYAHWVDAQVRLLRAGRFKALDLTNLIDEVEDLGRSAFKGFLSAIEVVMIYMLKWYFQPERRSLGWIASIVEHRARIADELEDSPSYAARIDEALPRAFRTARAAAARQTRLPLERFPAGCPYDWAAIVSRGHQLGI